MDILKHPKIFILWSNLNSHLFLILRCWIYLRLMCLFSALEYDSFPFSRMLNMHSSLLLCIWLTNSYITIFWYYTIVELHEHLQVGVKRLQFVLMLNQYMWKFKLFEIQEISSCFASVNFKMNMSCTVCGLGYDRKGLNYKLWRLLWMTPGKGDLEW